jgi:hypothetical protein
MTVARIGLAGTALLAVLTPAALAEQGMVTKIDRLNHMIPARQLLARVPRLLYGVN